nr:MAG TPA_asm: hypothetical protein [Caudoviricetes sp.]DAQ25759.1 MAG TPA: hypothetical protein [Caudoviricetes sp.]
MLSSLSPPTFHFVDTIIHHVITIVNILLLII